MKVVIKKSIRTTLITLIAVLMSTLSFAEAPVAETKVYWIDVRSAEEYAQGHHSQAVNIPHTIIASKIEALTPDKSSAINVYCRSGKRAGIAQKTLQDMGYTKVTNIGGYQNAKAFDKGAEGF